MTCTSTRALAELIAQHDRLRGLMDECEGLAYRLDARPSTPQPLARSLVLTRLRLALDAHNHYEESVLGPILLEQDPYAGPRVARMVEDHAAEHRTLHERLDSPTPAQLRDLIETLRAHLDAEERYLVTPRVLRDPSTTRRVP